MVSDAPGVPFESLLPEAARLLDEGGYRVVRDAAEILDFPPDRGLLAEDRYGIVAVATYPTWTELQEGWPVAQAALVDAMSARLAPSQPKAWEGYLVLLTPALVGPSARDDVERIRYDTSRLRKLVATGDDLKGLGDLRRTLLPLMPLQPAGPTAQEPSDILDLIVSSADVTEEESRLLNLVLTAFRERTPLLERLHEQLQQ